MDRMDEVREWINYADKDMKAVHQLLSFHPPQIEIICYHCQQSAEKILKAFLVYMNTPPPKTHDLVKLNCKCENIDSSFDELTKSCIRLNDYSSQSRYPFGLEITETDMQLALKDSDNIYKFTVWKIKY